MVEIKGLEEVEKAMNKEQEKLSRAMGRMNEIAKRIKDYRTEKGKNEPVAYSQMRKFYDEFLRIYNIAKSKRLNEGRFEEEIIPLLHLFLAKAYYAKGRKTINEEFKKFLEQYISKIKKFDDLHKVKMLFEALTGYYKFYKNK